MRCPTLSFRNERSDSDHARCQAHRLEFGASHSCQAPDSGVVSPGMGGNHVPSCQPPPREPRSLLFVDGFAGPGIYEDGSDGSPILALKAILDHSLDLPVPVRFAFIERDSERFECLETLVTEMRKDLSQNPRIDSVKTHHGECDEVIQAGIDGYDEREEELGPALFFLDQFGYSEVPMGLIERIMSHGQCEVFSYLNWEKMNRFLSDPSKWNALDAAFGGDDWQPALEKHGEERQEFIFKTYRDCLKAKASTRYVWHFGMLGKNRALLHWLFFCTNSLRGLEEMKRAMTTVDKSGCFQFSDRDSPLQLEMFGVYTDDLLADTLHHRLAGKTMTGFEVKQYTLEDTPHYRYKRALRILWKRGQLEAIDPPAGWRKGTFADENIAVRFTARR